MRHGIFSIRADGEGLSLLRETPGPAAYSNLHASPDGKRIVFSRCTKDLNDDCVCDGKDYFTREIVVSDLDGSHELIAGPDEGGFNHYPNWAPDGQSVIFVHSTRAARVNAGLYKFDLKTRKMSRLLDRAEAMETDNFWNTDGSISLVSQPIKDGKAVPPNNIFRFHPDTGSIEEISFSTATLGRHCCAADPKFSPDMKTLAYAQFRSLTTTRDKTVDNWDIVLKSTAAVTILGRPDAEDYWPMWSQDSSRLLWISYSPQERKYSISFYSMVDSAERRMDLIGDGIEFKSGDGGFLFGHIGWADWLHPKMDAVLFPATFAAW